MSDTPPTYAEIAIALPVLPLFTYAVPSGMTLQVGHAVLVPFGARKVTGYVITPEATTEREGIRPIERLLDPAPVLSPQQLTFCRWVADYYLSGLGEVIAMSLPSTYRRRTRRVFVPSDSGISRLADQHLTEGPTTTLLREVVARPGRSRSSLVRRVHGELDEAEAGRALDALVRARLVVTEDREVGGAAGRIRTVTLTPQASEATQLGGARMRGVLARLTEAGGPLDLAELISLEGEGARSAVGRLVQRGLVTTGTREDRTAAASPGLEESSVEPPPPNPTQQAALDALAAAETGTFLLHGVTGSGKTEVYLQAAARTLASDRQVLVLVPEIALTPLLTGRFRARFGERVAVLHSGLTPVERLREWRRIRAGDATVAVGARSALFAPFRDLGLIVVDEEHDDSYKQDDGVRYNARDMAVVRGHLAGCPVVLGSATPSVETWSNAQNERYGLLRLPTRATPRAVPRVELLDMRGQSPRDPLAPELTSALRDTFRGGGKAIVLYNRRGYAPVVECPSCGGHYECPSCGVGMVYHRKRGRLICHYCAFYRQFQKDCPSCGDELQVLGHGTERVEEALSAAFPDVGVVRMDADTTSGRGAHLRILESFRSGEAQLLVGTQVVAKGHDFPDVRVAAVVGVDHILMLPDFRSAERTYSLVTQLAGRAGRGERPGRVLVQTRQADHFVFRLLAAAQQLEGTDALDAFYREETRQRRLLWYPPYARLVMLRVEGSDRRATHARAVELAQLLRRAAAPERRVIDVLGPVAAPLARLVGRWRFQLVLRGREPRRFRAWLKENRAGLTKRGRGGVRVIVDVDPRSLL